MAYAGSTAASPNPPILLARGLGGPLAANSTSVNAGNGIWFYNSSNLTTDLTDANFFSDAKALGMRNGDVVMGVQYSTQSSTGHITFQGIVTAVSTSGARLSTGGTMTSTFA